MPSCSSTDLAQNLVASTLTAAPAIGASAPTARSRVPPRRDCPKEKACWQRDEGDGTECRAGKCVYDPVTHGAGAEHGRVACPDHDHAGAGASSSARRASGKAPRPRGGKTRKAGSRRAAKRPARKAGGKVRTRTTRRRRK
jgi:hypothetical protein